MQDRSRMRLLLIAMFTTTLISFTALSFLFIRYLTTNVQSDVPVKVLRDVEITVPEKITVGEQFEYRVTGFKDVDSKPSVRRQIECEVKGGQISETLDVVQPDNSVGRIDFTRFMTIPTYRQNLVNSDKCVIVFIAEYSFYTKSLVSEDQVYIPISQTFRSNEFKLTVPEAADDDEDEQTTIDPSENGTPSQPSSGGVTAPSSGSNNESVAGNRRNDPQNNDDGQANGSSGGSETPPPETRECEAGIDLLGLVCIGGR